MEYKFKNTMINFEEFKKVEIRIGKIVSAEKIIDSQKLLKLEVDLGIEKRQIIAGIGISYSPEFLIGKMIPIVCNLEPKTLMGFESQGMILAADSEDGPVLMFPEKDVSPGSIIK